VFKQNQLTKWPAAARKVVYRSCNGQVWAVLWITDVETGTGSINPQQKSRVRRKSAGACGRARLTPLLAAWRTEAGLGPFSETKDVQWVDGDPNSLVAHCNSTV
jgi:hypothetical protein